MYINILIVILVLASVSCRTDESRLSSISITPESRSTPRPSEVNHIEGVVEKISESFSDEVHIGRSRRNRVQIDILERGIANNAYKPNNLAIIKFYSRGSSNEWDLKQMLEIKSEALMEASPQIEDFNNDGLKDITFISNTAARGANEVRTLLIYDKSSDSLIHIKNSEDYPNMAYNKDLNCIDSWMVHGASTTVFLHLEGNLLKEFASVGTGANEEGNCCRLTVTVTDAVGKETVVRRKKIKEDDIYTRYRTFNPPRP